MNTNQRDVVSPKFFLVAGLSLLVAWCRPRQRQGTGKQRVNALLVAAAWLALLPGLVHAGATTRVSVDSTGAEADSESSWSSVSADGRHVAFMSYAANLVVGETNGSPDIFVHDRQTGTTTRVSVDSAGVEGNRGSVHPGISADGRYVAFESLASNLVVGDTNGVSDIFVHDQQTGATTRVSLDSADTEANGSSELPSLSADGRYVVFRSLASNLVAGDTKGAWDVFVHDRQTGATTRVSVNSAGVEANGHSGKTGYIGIKDSPGLSGDGRYIAFTSAATNLVADDTNGVDDIFIHDRETGATTRVSLDPAGTEANSASFEASLSGDGRYVVFGSAASNLVAGDANGQWDVFVHDQLTGATTRVSLNSVGTESNGQSRCPALSADGRSVAFMSSARNLVAYKTTDVGDIFVHDLQTGATTRASLGPAGMEANNWSFCPSLSADGRYVAFESQASNLVAADYNSPYLLDVFVHDRGAAAPEREPPVRDDPPVVVPTPGVSNALVVTHGWNSSADAWLYETALGICGQLPGIAVDYQSPVADGMVKLCHTADWDVWVQDWRSPASDGVMQPWLAYDTAVAIGRALGVTLKMAGYRHIHLIAHGAGANMIDHAADGLKNWEPLVEPLAPSVHETFLDAYDPYQDATTYGRFADWSDNYVDTRVLDLVPDMLDGTKLFLNHAYSINVTPTTVPDGCGFPEALDRYNCRHGRPYRFYALSMGVDLGSDSFYGGIDSIDGTGGMGYPLSVEKGATLAALKKAYPPQNGCAMVGGTCVPDASSSAPWTFDPTPLSATAIAYTSGAVEFVAGTAAALLDSLKLGASTVTVDELPSWIVVNSTTTDRANTLRFNWSFVSGGEGFLRVFVDDIPVSEIDQRYVLSASAKPERVYVGELAPGVHKLAFRLDGFGANASGVDLTNVELGLGSVATLPNYTLAITRAGTGTGTVASSPAGIACGTDCGESYVSGTAVALTATAAAGSAFAGWTGTNATECATGTVVMSASKSCTATFVLLRNTGFRAPTANLRDSGGDGTGYEISPGYAYSTNGVSAVDYNSGNTTSTSCTDGGKDKHRFYNFGFAIPATSAIKGLQVRLKARADSSLGSPKICVQVSWNGGLSWTAPKNTTTLGTTLTIYALGSATDTWGRSWSPGDFTNTNFRVRVIDVASSTARDFSLDSVAVNVSYY